MPDWTDIAQGFLVGGFPWISQLKRLRIHFEMSDLDVRGVFNFFASLFALAIFSYLEFAQAHQVLDLPEWWVLIASAAALTVIFVGIFVLARDSVRSGVRRWPVVLNFPLYISIFAALTAGFGILKKLEPYILYQGQVVRQDPTRVPIEGATVIVQGKDGDPEYPATTDASGHFRLLIPREPKPVIRRIVVTAPDYVDFEKPTENLLGLFASYTTIPMRPSVATQPPD